MRLALFSSGRQDAGIIAPVMRALIGGPVTPLLIAGGLHRRDGAVPERIEGLAVAAAIDVLPDDDSDAAIAVAAGRTTTELAALLPRLAAEALLLVGDRSETLAAAVAATCLRLPIIHLHGGEVTRGAIDDACRDALSQLAQLHAVAHEPARLRLRALGIDDARIHVTGAPGLDACFAPVASAGELAALLGVGALPWPLLAVTHHPATLGSDPADEIAAVLAGIDDALATHPQALVVATAANRDAGGERINARLAAQAARDPRWRVRTALGHRLYLSLLAHADVVIGNSSSGIIEAPLFAVPVLNLGSRQDGRLRCPGTSDLPAERHAIATALHAALALPRRPRPAPAQATVYGDGRSAPRIATTIVDFARLPPSRRLARAEGPS